MRELISNANCVLFDFDGPVCDLFAVHPAEDIAHRLRALAGDLGVATLLSAEAARTPDPQRVLRELAEHGSAGRAVAQLEAALTREETAAAATARPTPYAAALIAALSTRGRQVAIATNNSPLAAERYLSRCGLSGFVAGRVHGRGRDLALLKPHPDSLRRALASAGTGPGRALMLGDSVTDLQAARAAGVAFLGYAPDPRAAEVFRAAGAEHVVESLERVLTALIAPPVG